MAREVCQSRGEARSGTVIGGVAHPAHLVPVGEAFVGSLPAPGTLGPRGSRRGDRRARTSRWSSSGRCPGTCSTSWTAHASPRWSATSPRLGLAHHLLANRKGRSPSEGRDTDASDGLRSTPPTGRWDSPPPPLAPWPSPWERLPSVGQEHRALGGRRVAALRALW